MPPTTGKYWRPPSSIDKMHGVKFFGIAVAVFVLLTAVIRVVLLQLPLDIQYPALMSEGAALTVIAGLYALVIEAIVGLSLLMLRALWRRSMSRT